MRLLAISDLHLGYSANREAVAKISPHPDDWLIVAGDVGEKLEHLTWSMDLLTARFARVLWVPGNHDLWYEAPNQGEARYSQLVEACWKRGVLTPEDTWVRWPGDDSGTLLCPMFLGYDYSFAPPGMGAQRAIDWAWEAGVASIDERRLLTAPHASIADWCADRVERTRARLGALPLKTPTVLINHFPLRKDLVRLPQRIERFAPWCGTTLTEHWHLRYRARVVVHGHLHMRATDWRDSVRFEEVAIGYPRHWHVDKGIDAYLREILPGPPLREGNHGPVWHR